jgi:hypothetical protein
VLPPGIPEYFLPERDRRDGPTTYDPVVMGSAEIRFVDTKLDVDTSRTVQVRAAFGRGVKPVDWDESEPVSFSPSDLETEPVEGATFRELPAAASNSRSYAAWTRDLASWLHRNQSLLLLRSAGTGLVSRLDESEREFRIRVTAAARERRDESAERLRRKYAPKLAAVQERLRLAENAVEREQAEARDHRTQAAVSIGATLLGAFLGRKRASVPVGRASTAMRGMSRSMRQSGDVARAQEKVAVVRGQVEDLEAEFQAELAAVEAATDPLTEEFEEITIRPKKSDIAVEPVTLVWVPRGA